MNCLSLNRFDFCVFLLKPARPSARCSVTASAPGQRHVRVLSSMFERRNLCHLPQGDKNRGWPAHSFSGCRNDVKPVVLLSMAAATIQDILLRVQSRRVDLDKVGIGPARRRHQALDRSYSEWRQFEGITHADRCLRTICFPLPTM